MYVIKKIVVFLILFLSIMSYVYPQLIDKTNQLNKTCVASFAALKSGQNGKSPSGIPYQMYGLKDGSDWILIVADTATLYSFRKTPKVDTLIPNSAFFDINLCQIIQQKSSDLKLKEKPVKIGDIALVSYYSFNSRSTRKFFNSFNAVETGEKKLSLLGKLIAPITGLFKLKLPKVDTKLLTEITNLKKQIDQQAKAFEDLKKENDKLKEQIAKAKPEEKKEEGNENMAENKVDSTAKKTAKKDSLKNSKNDISKKNPKANGNKKENKNEKISPKNEAKIVNVTDNNKKGLPGFKSTGDIVNDSLRYQMDFIIYQIDKQKEIQELQYKKIELRKKKKELEGGASAQHIETPSKEQRIKETMKMMEEIDMVMVQLDKDGVKKEFAKKKVELEQKRRELQNELLTLEREK